MSGTRIVGAQHVCSVPLAYSVAGAAEATGISETLVRAALKSGLLKKHYLNTKVVILATDLIEWIGRLPTTKPGDKSDPR